MVEFGRVFTGGPDITVRCLSDARPALRMRAWDGTLCLELAGPDPVEELVVRAAVGDPLAHMVWPSGHDCARVFQAASAHSQFRAIPPFDFVAGEVPMSPLPGANAIVVHEIMGSPVGDFVYHDVFVDGILTGRHGGDTEGNPLVRTRMSFAAHVSPYKVPLLERLEGSWVSGRDDAALMLVAGLYDRAVLRRVIYGLRERTNGLLARLAAHVNTERFRQLAVDVLEETS